MVSAGPTMSGFTTSCTTRMKVRVLAFVPDQNLLSFATCDASSAFSPLLSPSSSSAPDFSDGGIFAFSERLSRKAPGPKVHTLSFCGGSGSCSLFLLGLGSWASHRSFTLSSMPSAVRASSLRKARHICSPSSFAGHEWLLADESSGATAGSAKATDLRWYSAIGRSTNLPGASHTRGSSCAIWRFRNTERGGVEPKERSVNAKPATGEKRRMISSRYRGSCATLSSAKPAGRLRSPHAEYGRARAKERTVGIDWPPANMRASQTDEASWVSCSEVILAVSSGSRLRSAGLNLSSSAALAAYSSSTPSTPRSRPPGSTAAAGAAMRIMILNCSAMNSAPSLSVRLRPSITSCRMRVVHTRRSPFTLSSRRPSKKARALPLRYSPLQLPVGPVSLVSSGRIHACASCGHARAMLFHGCSCHISPFNAWKPRKFCRSTSPPPSLSPKRPPSDASTSLTLAWCE
mmetsp:Transcript_38045/g.123069  ORF Transcript_38045/g.123069 Transcript_38045/m.123069 type:complete len:461 (-) Transcript_38045:914-2296(-)